MYPTQLQLADAGTRNPEVDLAGEGTLFLDEVSELSPRMQGKLLRLLEAREYSPVGSTATKISKARFITATNVDLERRVESGEFREDLYYRLNVVNIRIPPLRERREDIPLLVEHLLKRINREIHKGIRRIPSSVMDALMAYSWPGNVRQLENVLMKTVVLSQGEVLNIADLPVEVVGEQAAAGTSGRAASELAAGPASDVSLKEMERDHIQRVLADVEEDDAQIRATLQVAKLQHGGGSDDAPAALTNLLRMAATCGVP